MAGFLSKLKSVFSLSEIDDDFYDELEETLITSDVGVNTTEEILEELKTAVKERKLKKPDECRQVIAELIKERMCPGNGAYDFENTKCVLLIVGVNGVGKTTSIAKLAHLYKDQGKKVILAAADTFRAGAIEQLGMWAERVGVDMIAHNEGSDPAAVVYDAVAAAKARDCDMLICDTAGRLHNKKNLMDELNKIYRILEREYSGAHVETLLVLDGTTGQNALSQAREFSQTAHVDGIILTKMEGTAKGGIGIAIESELGLYVKFIGTGERADDISRFDANAYVDGIFLRQ